MAWRDSRRNKSRLLLFVSSIILGIGALVAVFSFRDNLQSDIDQQAKMLTGADLVIESRKQISKSASGVLDSLGDERAAERSFASMIYFINNNGSRLVQVKALEGNFPFYGDLETTPAAAGRTFTESRGALVDRTVMLQYGAKVGDSIKIGAISFRIDGALNKAPGQSGVSTTVAPIVYIPLQYLKQTGLIKQGSRIQYKYYFKYNQPLLMDVDLKKHQAFFEKEDLDTETVESRKESTGRSFRDVNRFLALSGFVALLLGCIGVGSSIQVYIKEKLGTIATLRCLGLRAGDAFLIYLIQVVGMGLLGAVLGSALGTGLQFLLPMVLKDFLPVELTMSVSWIAVLQGLLLGMFISILFALPALLSVRRISPLNALRMSFEKLSLRRDPIMAFVYLLIVVFVLVFTRMQMSNWMEAGAFTVGIMMACLILFCFTKMLMWLIRVIIPSSLGYVYRQGFANLYRPNNQTMVLSVSIGLATTFICTLFFMQDLLIKRITISSDDSQANMVLFDIQSNQKDTIANLARSYKLPIVNQVPIVTVRIESINGKTAKDFQGDSVNTSGRDSVPSERAFRGELRVTFQDKLTAAEKIIKGVWSGTVEKGRPVLVSLEDGYAKRIRVDVGDSLVFNVQGMLIPAVVGSLREVNWTRMQTNFRVVFPKGVLEDAPQFHVLMTRVPTDEVSAKFQGDVIRNFPNVSAIDLGLILRVLEDLLSKISFVIRFMAAFSIVTGWIVLISAIMNSKDQRLREHVLLRTLGASRAQIISITAVEHLCLGMLAAGTGVLLSFTASWLLAKFSFDTTFSPPLIETFSLFLLVTVVTVITGIVSSRKIFNTPPIAILNS
ncbi:MAG: FtsX-like permease family protein [Pedobacter sp.]|nr:MAG: FtsX-like permease family protein [Pedobacter sp.]